ncbi:aldo/keto reductase [Corynebacterium sp. TAE3-ERU12]|nr:aldo/keto reductase [Corynebacterium sp. TAE3-ERU12]MBV7295562.1 aldo/keto reductase [Corynebacterium sp. TAE3-ERU12]
MTDTPFLQLNDGHRIPQLGLGTYKMDDATARSAVRTAISLGYRHIDTAAFYDNEGGVGAGIADAIAAGDVSREDLYVTTKVWNDDQGAERTRASAAASLQRLGLDYVDLLLVHWPVPSAGRYVETYETIMELRDEGLTRSAGVANFYPEVLADLPEAPAVNQVELHPGYPQNDLVAEHAKRGIITESWAPLGRGQDFDNPQLKQLAADLGRTPAQVVLRWHLDRGLVAIPKSAHADRVAENFDVLDFRLDDTAMTVLAGLAGTAGNRRIGGDPRTFGG